jgi:hypothetical protein
VRTWSRSWGEEKQHPDVDQILGRRETRREREEKRRE